MSERAGLDILFDALRARQRGETVSLEGVPATAIGAAIAIAGHNKITSLVAQPLIGFEPSREVFDQHKLTAFYNNSMILRETLRVCGLLERARVRHVVVKGPLQQNLIYGDYFVRAALDIDVLVHRGDYVRARTALQGGDYTLLSPSIWWWAFLGEQHFDRPGVPGSSVDLHWSLHQPGTPASREAGRFIDEARRVRHNGVDIPILSDRHAALLAVISIAKALYNREPAGAHLLDLFAMLKSGAPEVVGSFMAEARQCGLGGHAAIALRALGHIFDADFSPSANGRPVLPGTTPDELVGLMFTPEAPGLKIARRRTLVWEFCDRNLWRYGLELGRMGAAQVALKMFERQPAV